MIPIEKKKSKQNKSKQLNIQNKKPKSKSTQKSLPKNRKSFSSLKKNQKLSPRPVSGFTQQKQKSIYSLQKNNKRNLSNKSQQRLSFNYEPKQRAQYKEIKYIFNPVGNPKNRNSLNINHDKQHSISHVKSYSNQIFSKHVPNQSTDLSSFVKSIQNSKMKKKSHDYIKTFNKTSVFEKLGSKMENTHVQDMSQTLSFGKTWTHGQSQKKLRQIKITDQELSQVNMESCPKISEIRQNVNNLFKKLKEPNRNKLLLITNNYEKLVSQLYLKVNGGQDNQHLILEGQKIKENQQNENLKTTQQSQKQSFNKMKRDSSSTSAMLEDSSLDTQHWDSYLQVEDLEKQNARTCPDSHSKQCLVKKLNLGDVKKMQIQQYQDEFMQNQQIFSQSWKRQIEQQKRF